MMFMLPIFCTADGEYYTEEVVNFYEDRTTVLFIEK